MDMDFTTKERLDDIEVIQFDDLAYQEVQKPSENSVPGEGSWFSLIGYWISELLWRRKYWSESKK